jgi:transposase
MRKIREILRMNALGLSARQIGHSLQVARSSVGEYLKRAAAAGLSWPLPEELDETAIERKLFPTGPRPECPRPLPDWIEMHTEMRKRGVTLGLLWEEYKGGHPDGYQYSRFADLYREWSKKLDLSMRQEHRAGEKMFVDYAGATVPVTDHGVVREAAIFVAVLGASNYTYAEATWTQTIADWTASHMRAFSFFGGVPEILVPDNLKSGVKKPCRYEPEINATYGDVLTHYGAVAIPARIRKPKDKSRAENGVLLVERWILARLRHRTFLSLAELNAEIRVLLVRLNDRPFRKLPGSRRSMYESLDKPALRPLPGEPYVFAEWKRVRINVDYHVAVDHHYYSVPYQLFGKELDVRMTATTVECFYQGRRVASHARRALPHRHTTVAEHMPAAHRAYAEWTPERILHWTGKAGPSTRTLAEMIIAARLHPQQAYRSCLGLLRLAKEYGEARLEAACARALRVQAISYTSVKSILKTGLDKEPAPASEAKNRPIAHGNIRGPEAFRGESPC